MLSWVIALGAGWLLPRGRALLLALVLPVFEYWAFYGLGSYDRNGSENWGLLLLPLLCLISAGLALLTGWLRRRRSRRVR